MTYFYMLLDLTEHSLSSYSSVNHFLTVLTCNVYMSVYLSINISIRHKSVCQSISLSTYPSISTLYIYIPLSFFLPNCLSFCISICLSIFLSTYPSVYVAFYLSVFQSVYLSIYMSIYLCNYLSVFPSVYISMSNLPSVIYDGC